MEYPNITIVRGKDDDLYDDTGSEYSEEEEWGVQSFANYSQDQEKI